jgi:hypothetical protein
MKSSIEEMRSELASLRARFTGTDDDGKSKFPIDPVVFNEQILGRPLRPLDNVPHHFMEYQIDIWYERQKDLIINKSQTKSE